MTIVDVGKNRVRDLLNADFSTGEVGTGTTPVLFSDTDLETPVAGTQNVVSTAVTDKQITVDYILPATEGNGSDVSEFGMWVNSDGALLSRYVFSGLTKESTEEWQFTVIYKVV